MIHPTTVISPQAEVDSTCEIGPYCIIGENVRLGKGCHLISHVSIQGPTTIGIENRFHPFCSIGGRTQDLKYTQEPTYLEIGDRNEFRECCTVNRGTAPGEKTIIGSDNDLLAYSHVAHNCVVGNHCIFSNNGTIGGHVVMQDYAVIGGLSAVHQFCRIGQHAMIGGCSKIVQDVPPYLIADGNPAEIRSINNVGLQRRGFTEDEIARLKKALRLLKQASLNTTQACLKIQDSLGKCDKIQRLLDFIQSSERGIIR
ncbi:MAG: acyl-ACP--UDP-N-acetylglucosamine O-acyltransferase [Verrucomicrobiota bacterium]